MNSVPRQRANILFAAAFIRGESLRHAPHANLSGASAVLNRRVQSEGHEIGTLLKHEAPEGCRP
jgi:hypothetical protein